MNAFYQIKDLITDERYYVLIAFVCLLVSVLLVSLSRKCFWKLVCKASGRTAKEVFEKRRQIIAERTGGASRVDDTNFVIYLQKNAPNRDALTMLYNIHKFALLPLVASIMLFALSLWSGKPIMLFFVLTAFSFLVSVALLVAAVAGKNHEFKYVEKQSTNRHFDYFFLICIIFAVIMCLFGIYNILTGVKMYNNQLKYNDWIKTQAFIIGEQKETKGYTYSYRYNTDKTMYYGEIHCSGKAYEAAQIIEIKYNPESPEQSTALIKPRLSVLIVNGVGGLAFIGMGIAALFSRKIYNSYCERHNIKGLMKGETI